MFYLRQITPLLLKAALFATGLAGIVAEYTLSTIATYFLGNSVFQWTMIVSMMLFSMGLGSRFSKKINNQLLEKFIFIEFLLSIIVSNVTIFVYVFFALYDNTLLIIYTLSVAVGLLVGMEIPLVVRINQQFQTLKVNISTALEYDYFGSLAGGVFFAFIGLPYLGLTYTPAVLGSINFIIALILLYTTFHELTTKKKSILIVATSITGVLLVLAALMSKSIVNWGDEIRYQDKIVHRLQSRYQKIVLTYYNGHYQLYLNGNLQFNTLDEVYYHEPLVHPIMHLHPNPKKILVLGGGDGLAVKELLKYNQIERIVLVDIDPAVTHFALNDPIMTSINQNALENPKVSIVNQDGFTFLENEMVTYDLIIVDLPDPRTIDLGRLYSKEFYWLCLQSLDKNGMIVTQAASPYYAQSAFMCIEKTLASVGFKTLPLHNQIPGLGEWGWIIGAKNQKLDLKTALQTMKLKNIPFSWMNEHALIAMSSFGKTVFEFPDEIIEINEIHHPVLYKYYLSGKWDLY